jgi:hypothetical protein
MQHDFFLVVRDVHPFFYNLAIIDTLGLQAFLMNIHHNTSLESILEHDSISSSSKACICSYLGKGASDAPPNSLIDSTTNPKVKTMEGERIGVCSLIQNILGVEGHA